MAKNQRSYDQEYRIQAVRLAQEMGSAAAARELGLSRNTLYTWVKRVKDGTLDIGNGAHKPAEARTLKEQLIQAQKQIKALEKESNRLKMENAFLEEAIAFFAASRMKSEKTSE